jgi:hypothetical protein
VEDTKVFMEIEEWFQSSPFYQREMKSDERIERYSDICEQQQQNETSKIPLEYYLSGTCDSSRF